MYKISLPCACDIAVLSQHIFFGSPELSSERYALTGQLQDEEDTHLLLQDQNAVHYGMVGLFLRVKMAYNENINGLQIWILIV